MSTSLTKLYFAASEIMSVLFYQTDFGKIDAENLEPLDSLELINVMYIMDTSQLVSQDIQYKPVFIRTHNSWMIIEGRPYNMLPPYEGPYYKERILAHGDFENWEEDPIEEMLTFHLLEFNAINNSITSMPLQPVDMTLFTKLVRLKQNQLTLLDQNYLGRDLIRQTIYDAIVYLNDNNRQLYYDTQKYGIRTADGFSAVLNEDTKYITDLMPIYSYNKNNALKYKPIFIKTTNTWLIVDYNLDVLLVEPLDHNLYEDVILYYIVMIIPGLKLQLPNDDVLQRLTHYINNKTTLRDIF